MSNDGTPLQPLASHTQRADPQQPMTAERHRLAQMSAGQLAELEMADEIRAAQSVVHKRLPDGSVVIEPRKPDSGPQVGQEAAAPQAQPTDKVRVGQYEISEAELGDLLQRTGQQDLGAATAPARAEDYQARLPEGFKLPDGIEFSIDDASPLLADARQFAFDYRLPQAAFERMVAMHAAAIGADAAQLNAAKASEISKLGATANQRVTAVNTWLEGVLGTELAKPMKTVMVTAGIVAGWERIMAKFQSQGAASFSQAHREPGNGSKVTEEQWAGMSEAARFEYARSHSQGAR
ncbi:hypothetical protein [Bradyrhizobium sp. USDA 4486]